MQITIREPGSALTHFIAMLLAAFAAAPLLTKAALYASRESIIALSIFCVSMILLYGASATYHSLNLSGRPLRIFRKIDHMMIFILIAGSYTPICLTVLGGKLGYTLLAVIWGPSAARAEKYKALFNHGNASVSLQSYNRRPVCSEKSVLP